MRIGVISDPHGCLVGLKAVLDWLDNEGIDQIFCAGDVANFGPQPNECISLLIERNIASVQGNSDRDILLPKPVVQPSDQRLYQITQINDWCRNKLTSDSRLWLASLPPRLTPAQGVIIVHGGVDSADEIVDVDAKPLFPQGVSVIVAGHLHVPFVNHTTEGVWVNAGSAGRPCDGNPDASLAILKNKSEGWDVSIQRTPFDIEEAVQAIHKTDIPFAERLIETQRNACWW
jgi:predicted phosphodiesterase